MPTNFFWNISLFIIIISLVIKSIKSATLQCLPCEQKLNKPSSYEEFEFEHQVTKQEAVNALNILNNTFFDAPQESAACKAIPCSPKIMKYCLGAQFLNDHCWCEQGHSEEGLPFVPHTCYVGEKQYGASVGSCYLYREVKRCCCLQALAKRWKHLSSSTRTEGNSVNIWLPFVTLVGVRNFGVF